MSDALQRMLSPKSIAIVGVSSDFNKLNGRPMKFLLDKNADVIAYPAPLEGESLARSIVAPHLDGTQEEVSIRMPMVVERFPAEEVYDWAAETLGAHLRAGRDVVYLCEGDPFVYGSFSYLYERMVDQYEVQVIPGVSSVMACAAALGTALATRSDVLGIVPATLAEDELRERLQGLEAMAIIKVGRHLDKVRRVLASLELLEQAHYVERATFDNEQTMKLSAFDGSVAPYFSMILVHRRGYAWC